MNDTLLEVEHLTVRYPDAAGLALDDVSLQVRRGEVLAVVGESGSGKSTLAGALVGTLPRGVEVRGSIRLDGRDLLRLDPRDRRAAAKDIGFVAQNPLDALNPCQRIGAQVAEGLRLHAGVGRRSAHERAVDLLAQMALPDPERTARSFPHQISGGMRQRAAIAMAIVLDPPLVVADEPTTALDATVQRQVLELLDRLRRERDQTLVFVSHDLALVSHIADRVLVLYGGRVAEERATGALVRAPVHPYSAGLLRAQPSLRSRTRPVPIPGSPPASVDRTVTCPFAPRCERADPTCWSVRPSVTTVDGGRVVCHHPRLDVSVTDDG